MNSIIKNKDVLLANAQSRKDIVARKLALGSLEAALKAADPSKIMNSIVKIKDSNLRVNGRSYDLSRFRRIFVLGGGKAGGPMARFLEGLLGDKITDGCVNILRGTGLRYRNGQIRLHEASHPIPDDSGLAGVRKMLKMIEDITINDLVICLLSGGGSALMPYPIHEVTLKDKKITTQLMLKSGATINELNCVRKHLSLVKGGGLAKAAYPATVLTLILSDVVGDPLGTIASGPTSPDPTTFGSAISILKRRTIWSLVPETVRKALKSGATGKIDETPKPGDKAFRNVANVVIGNNRTVCKAAEDHARKVGAKSIILTSLLEGEAREVGTVVSSIAREFKTGKGSLEKPVVTILGGETTVTVMGTGRGGRNQEMALSASLKLDRYEGVAIAAIGTDGLDGNSPAAGAIVDGSTLQRARSKSLNPIEMLQNNDSYGFFHKLNDTIITGATGTNLNDVIVAAVV